MTDDGWLAPELANDLFEMIGDLVDRFAGEGLGMGTRIGDGLRIIRPAGSDGRVASLFKHGSPSVPAAGQEPHTMDEGDRDSPRCVGRSDLLRLVLCDTCHGELLPAPAAASTNRTR